MSKEDYSIKIAKKDTHILLCTKMYKTGKSRDPYFMEKKEALLSRRTNLKKCKTFLEYKFMI